MRNTILLIAICLIANLAFSQERDRDRGRRNNDNRILAEEIRRDVIRKIHRNIYQDGHNDRLRDIRVYAGGRRGAWRNDLRYGTRGAAMYDGRRYLIRDEIRREIRRTRYSIRNGIRSATRWWRD